MMCCLPDACSSKRQSLQHTALCKGSNVMQGGKLRNAELQGFHIRLKKLLCEAEARTGDKRSAASGKHPGHQKTPAFVLSLVKTAVTINVEGKRPYLPKGGFTDVGLHTGGIPRDTAWPLARETCRVLLAIHCSCTEASTHPEELWAQALAHFDLWILKRQVAAVKPRLLRQDILTGTMQILDCAAAKGSLLVQSGQISDEACNAFLEGCCTARNLLDNAAAKRALRKAQAFTLEPGTVTEMCGSDCCHPPLGKTPAAMMPRATSSGLKEARARAQKNLGALPVLQAFSSAFKDAKSAMCTWKEWAASNGKVAPQLALRSLEEELFRRAAEGISRHTIQISEMDDLAEAVDMYREILSSLMGKLAVERSMPMLSVELRSRELLVVWVAFCLVHASMGEDILTNPMYGVALRWEDLRHLTLSDKLGTDAALGVATYLKQWRSHPGGEVFSLRDNGSATFQMATEYSARNAKLNDCLTLELRDAKARVDAHWAEVQRKQSEARTLRTQLAHARAKVSQREAEKEAARVSYQLRPSNASTIRRFDDACHYLSSAEGEVRALEIKLKAAEQSPQPVIQPLPKDNGRAQCTLFFLHMPRHFRHLSRLSFLGQQLLLPVPPGDQQRGHLIQVAGLNASLHGHHGIYRRDTWCPSPTAPGGATEGAVGLMTKGSVPEQKDIGSRHVDYLNSPSDGVWYPDSLHPAMSWKGGGKNVDHKLGGVFFNPFASLPNGMVVDYFTEPLDKDYSQLQWAMPQYGSVKEISSTRGNEALARQDMRPIWLTKPGYLDFGSLRSYPCGQLRRLCCILKERSLPFSHPAVQTLVRQALYHLGSLSGTAELSLFWRTEFTPTELLPMLELELSKLASDLSECPRDWESVVLLGEIAAFISNWHSPCKSAVRKFAAATRHWANIHQDLPEDDDSKAAQAKQARQCLLRMASLNCYGTGELSLEDIEEMVLLSVQIWHGIFLDERSGMMQRQVEMAWMCANVMARRHREVMEGVERDPGILTRSVQTVLDHAPSTLTNSWKQLRSITSLSSMAAYEAVGEDGYLYSINVLDGTVLLNGCPPGKLPREVLKHRLYRRTFHRHDFEVSGNLAMIDGKLSTTHPQDGRFNYVFFFTEDDGLAVHEQDQELASSLELLDPGSDLTCGVWGGQLPVRLRELCSHWINR